MSASAEKGDRKREIEQSPKKKKIKDSTISREDLDELREDIQVTNKSVKELREELEAIATVAKQTRDRVDSDRRTVTDLRNQLERLTEKMTDMEDRSRRNNVRLVGLPEGAEGSNVVGFLRVNLSKWIPSLKGHDIEIDRAHRVYDGGRGSDRPCTLIFRVLRWHDRSEILKGARQAYPVKCAEDNVTLLIFPDFSPATTIRRKAFGPVLKKMTSLGLQPFLTYPAVIKLRHKGEQMSFDSPQKVEDFVSALSQQRTYAAVLREGNGKTAATISRARREGLDGQDGHGRLLNLFFAFSSLLSSTGIMSLYIWYNDLFAGKTDTPFSFFGGG